MSIKNLFKKQNENSSLKSLLKKNIDGFSDDVESQALIEETAIASKIYIPDVDYSTASNFSKFGSSELYYDAAIKRIYTQYPYDGSAAEKKAYDNSLTPLEKHIVDNEYPRYLGHAVFGETWGETAVSDVGFYSSSNPEYISCFSHARTQTLDTSSNQAGSFQLDWDVGATIEFWMKKNSFEGVYNSAETIFDIRNTLGTAKFMMWASVATDPVIYLDYKLSTDSFASIATSEFQMPFNTGLTTIADGEWHHYAFVLNKNSGDYQVELYVDGVYNSTQTQTPTTTTINLTGSAIATIGSLGGAYATGVVSAGYGKLSGSLDEFRFWQTDRTAKDISKNYFTKVHGGGNTDSSKINSNRPLALTAYFRFNEPSIGITAVDDIVLDYSGRLVNGTWHGHNTSSRATGSAISDTGDLIIYSGSSDVQTYIENKRASGRFYDASNNASLANSIPAWILDEDRENGNELSNLLQIIGSYLDTVYLQIENINKTKDLEYKSSTVKSFPHNNKILNSLGFETPELFVDNSVLEVIAAQDNKRLFENRLEEVKGLIYKNIHNNLNYIYKSKGTEKAFRNLVRCYGVDDSLFNIAIHANNHEQEVVSAYEYIHNKFSTIDFTNFSSGDNKSAVIYSYGSASSDVSGYISGSAFEYMGNTLEVSALFPKYPKSSEESLYPPTSFMSQSLFGIVEAAADSTDLTYQTTDNANISVFAVNRDNITKFVLTSSLGFYLESDPISNVYEDTTWNISYRINAEQDEFADNATASANSTISFNGYNYNAGILQDSFEITGSTTRAIHTAFNAAPKRIWAGAKRTNVTGAIANNSNYRLINLNYWSDGIDNDELKAHALDLENMGRRSPGENTFSFQTGLSASYIPKIDTLSLSWNFDSVTGSDSSGEFVLQDVSSGSLARNTAYETAYGKLAKTKHTGYGYGFEVSSEIKKVEFLETSRRNTPEEISSEELISILETDDDVLEKSTRPTSFYFSFEANMFRIISKRMLQYFASIEDFNNLIGEPTNRYAIRYKKLEKLKEIFYERVENTPDIEKFVSLYKWLDSSLDAIVKNLIPASADTNDEVATIIESHVLERSSHEGSLGLKGVYNYKKKEINDNMNAGAFVDSKIKKQAGKYPISTDYSNTEAYTPPVYGKGDEELGGTKFSDTLHPETRAEKVTTIAGGIQRVPAHLKKRFNIPRKDQALLDSTLNSYSENRYDSSNSNNVWSNLREEKDPSVNTRVQIHDAINRSYALQARSANNFEMEDPEFVSGINRNKNIFKGYFRPFIKRTSTAEIADNYFSLGFDDIQSYLSSSTLTFKNIEKLDIFFNINGVLDATDVESYAVLPFTAYSSSVEKGYQKDLTELSHPITIIGHHDDTEYLNGSPGLQSPFNKAHVGGFNHRSQPVNRGSDDASSRAEQFKILSNATGFGLYPPWQAAELAFARPIFNLNFPTAIFSKEEYVRRVVNTRNISYNSSSLILGNYRKNYEVVSAGSRATHNLAFIDQNGFTQTTSSSPVISGDIEYANPTRTVENGTSTKSFFVTKFSSPGGAETEGAFLDIHSGQYSVYNNLNYRNLGVRKSLNNIFLASPSALGGLVEGSTTTGSYHKVNRNNATRVKEVTRATPVYSPTYDESDKISNNFHVQSSIPRTDYGYKWIHDSLNTASSTQAYLGHVKPSGISGGVTLTNFHTGSSYFTNNAILTRSFGYPSWKQVRVGQTNSASLQRRANIYENRVVSKVFRERDEYTIKTVTHPPVTSKFKPIYHKAVMDGEEVEFEYAYASSYNFFGDNYDESTGKNVNFLGKNNAINLKKNTLLEKIAQNESIRTKAITYKEVVWPKESRTYLKTSRERADYLHPWRDDETDRITQSETVFGLNVYNPDLFSTWPLDTTATGFNGELMQGDSDDYYLSASITSMPVGGLTYFVIGARYTRLQGITTPKCTVHGSGSPFYDSYEDFNEDIRRIGKDYSIIPEYNFTNKASEYFESGGSDILEETNQLFLSGTLGETSSLFIENFVNSDQLSSHVDIERLIGKPTRFKLSFSGIKKVLPYKGFYPQERTLQLARIFETSHKILNVFQPSATGTEATFRTALAPFYSPGICYNSIKAGIAVDYPILNPDSLTAFSRLTDLTNSPFRTAQKALPFEAILDPIKGLLSSTSSLLVSDADSDIQVDSTASFSSGSDALYKKAANNWYGSVPDLFLRGGGLTSLESAKEEDWVFDNVSSSSGITKYVGYIKLNKTTGFANYRGGNAFGPSASTGVNLHHVPPYWRGDEEFDNTSASIGYARIEFDPAPIEINDPDRFYNGKFTLDDIIKYSTITYGNKSQDDIPADNYMTLSASVNMFNKQDSRWKIQTKWECPNLNFAEATGYTTGSVTSDEVMIGMWHQYGTIPEDREGLLLEAAPSEATDSSYQIAAGTSSLMEACGFKNVSKRIGEIADRKDLSEYIAVIPYYTNERGKDVFLTLDLREFEASYTNLKAGTNNSSLDDMLFKMSDVMLPPRFNFLKKRKEKRGPLSKEEYNPILAPFALYLFEFTHSYSQLDLSHWWQGILPESGKIATKEDISIDHDIKAGEILSPRTLAANGLTSLPENLRFKIIKLKKKAVSDFNYLKTGKDSEEYSYNWPYDFFSLVEMGKLSIELEYGDDDDVSE